MENTWVLPDGYRVIRRVDLAKGPKNGSLGESVFAAVVSGDDCPGFVCGAL